MRIIDRVHGRARRRAACLAGLAVLAVGGISACGQDDSSDGEVAAVDGASSGSSATADGGSGADGSAPTDPDEQALAFTQCLREEGLDVDDPAPGEGLMLQFGPETDPETVDAAMEACREFAPGAAPGGSTIDPEAAVEHAGCMRENGVEAFPDPDADGRVMIGPEVADDPDFESASAVCDELLGLPE